jgi:hypothetical protein
MNAEQNRKFRILNAIAIAIGLPTVALAVYAFWLVLS